jgi:hypothetical protein
LLVGDAVAPMRREGRAGPEHHHADGGPRHHVRFSNPARPLHATRQ